MTYRPRRRRRTAEPIQWMNPVPRATAPQQQLQRDYGLPRRMQLHLWEASKDDVFDTEVLVAHTIDFWQQYRAKRYTFLSEAGDNKNTNLRDWGLMYMTREGMARDEMELLYRFMAATTIIPEKEYLEFQNLLDTSAVFYHNRISY